MLLFLKRELKIAARNWELAVVNALIATALALVFSAVDYRGGLLAAVLISSFLYSHLLLLREEELGTLDGLRLLKKHEEFFLAKTTATALLNLLTSASYTAVYAAASLRPVDFIAAVYTPAYLGVVSTASAFLALSTRTKQIMSLFLTSALSLGFSASLVREGLSVATALTAPAFAAIAIALSRELS
ncbi:hypothetical protein [Pyrobaculum aerophilum]|uniref:Uncharacterized protein n=2 Tax=Pyrobaculum aerophilum TaxID=13773 RepID=Q8ZSR5_PYRAE|nr:MULTISPECIES: hypothetical protein [Pyrobaculum]AAL65048.1 hypothetical protein PAE3618 [Pyrobaculum aerophilum str. IM2]MCX8137644.1 hypothetical protein [Pyrobaculum aerophilum]HII47822.1 hypothetical protein [Pyrobaculum aerophilum]